MAKEIIEENDKINKNKEQIQNGGNYLDNKNINNINNIEDVIKEKYVDPEIIKQKARNDATLLMQEFLNNGIINIKVFASTASIVPLVKDVLDSLLN